MKESRFKVRHLDRVLLLSGGLCVALVSVATIGVTNLVLDRVTETIRTEQRMSAESMTRALTRPLLGGDYRFAWRVLERSVDDHALSAFQIVDGQKAQIVEDPDSAARFREFWAAARPAMEAVGDGRGAPLVSNAGATFIEVPIAVEGGTEKRVSVQFLYSTSKVDETFFWIRVLNILLVGIVSSLIIAVILFARSKFERGMLALNNGIAGFLVSGTPVESEKIILDEYFHSHEMVRGFREEFFRLQDQVRTQAELTAVARTTQALAHDVRKPFSMFKSIIQVIEATKDPLEVREVLKLTLPEVNQAMASVEGMIQDVMQIGADATLHMEDAAPESLIESALGDLFRVYPEADVALSYDLSHRHMVKVDSVRLNRVFANILGNAVQAMREKGSLWIRTSEREGFVEYTLGNGGSVILPESLPKLFDAFFTSGKKGGTGLGLAIAKKIVEAHGGTIRCVSEKSEKYPEGMVEFRFTLPISNAICSPRSEPLPRTSREIQAALAAVRIAAARQGGQGPDPREAEIEATILSRLCAEGRPNANKVAILVVEDESVYRNGLLALLERSEALSAHVRIVFARNDEEALAAARECAPVLLIEDVDLGPSSKDGLEIVKTMREKGFAGHICVHSNRFLAGDNKAALAAGADTVLPKPLGRAHFLKLLLASLPEETPSVDDASSSPKEAEPSRKLTVAMLDDSISMRMAWKMELEDETNFRAFASTTAFLEACANDPSYFASLDVVVTDFNFAPGDPHDGGSLARELRLRGYSGLILRSSGESDLGADIEALFDGDVGKCALEWPAFHTAVEAAQARRRRA